MSSRRLTYIDLDKSKCNNCGLCIQIAPEIFAKGFLWFKPSVKSFDQKDYKALGKASTAALKCPCKCISYFGDWYSIRICCDSFIFCILDSIWDDKLMRRNRSWKFLIQSHKSYFLQGNLVWIFFMVYLRVSINGLGGKSLTNTFSHHDAGRGGMAPTESPTRTYWAKAREVRLPLLWWQSKAISSS